MSSKYVYELTSKTGVSRVVGTSEEDALKRAKKGYSEPQKVKSIKMLRKVKRSKDED